MFRLNCRLATIMLLALPMAASAGPLIDSLCGRGECPRGEYSPLHYWTPGLYRLRACVHPSNLDQYPPGVDVPSVVDTIRYRCPGVPPEPTRPYADPAGYYGGPEVPNAAVPSR